MALTTITTFTNGPDLWTPSLLPGLTDGVLGEALAGNDTVVGTQFADSILGGQGEDSLLGAGGNDTIYGGQGNDTIEGGAGNNWISANQGNDYIIVTSPGDTVYGGQGDDIIIVNTTNAFVSANKGNDTITSSQENSQLYGGQGNDLINLTGGSSQIVQGNIGDDTITSSGGEHLIYGGQGDDRIIISGASTKVNVAGDLGNNIIELGEGVIGSNITIFGGQNPANTGGQTPQGISTIIVNGNNNLIGANISNVGTINVNQGVTTTINASTIIASGATKIGGSGTVNIQGTLQQLTQLTQTVTITNTNTLPIVTDNNNIFQAVGLSRSRFNLATGLTQFFVIDGAQFAPIIAQTNPNVTDPAQLRKLNIGALSFQFGQITQGELSAIRTNPAADIPASTQAKMVNFGTQLNDAKYIPQVNLQQADTLLSGFYTLISQNGITPVKNRFFSVIDTKGTTATTDDVTTLYYSSNGQFDLGTSEKVFTSTPGLSVFTPSNTGVGPLSLATIPASTQIIPFA
ncbi:calcium-binding protein [Geminocystis sp. GBBB08]|uniref:calcium-binding protein n=1 Tax=Geminocystis sp. GBBB08 TaxID=2604140 RepID=UPI0027E3308F|nr:calcium-binding protein [Geminocystis sp. GBBB08]MBL1208676.1 calcium-binding protein [Geminocystis sp. GBBB08]